jgi:hypothetical protein
MKKVVIALSVMTFLMVGLIAVNSVVAKQVSSSVYDDPPKKDKDAKTKKSCCTPGEMKSCKTPCTDKTEVKADDKKQESGTSTSVTTETKETKKTDPDKK